MWSPALESKKLIAQYKTEYVKEDWEMGLVDSKYQHQYQHLFNKTNVVIEYNKVSISGIKMSIVSPWVHSPVITPCASPVCIKEMVVMLKHTYQAEGKQIGQILRQKV